MWKRRLEDGTTPSEFAMIVGVVVLLSGTCLIQSGAVLLVSILSRSPYVKMVEYWTSGWTFDVCSFVASLFIAVALAAGIYRAGLVYARQPVPEPRERPHVRQFTLKSLLLLQFYVAVGLGLIAWLGRPVIPGVLGIFGAMAGYGATLASARRRVFDVVAGYLIGAVIGAAAIMADLDLPTMQEGRLNEDVRGSIVVATLATLPLVALVATWKLHLRRQREKGEGRCSNQLQFRQ
jgi:hypothetical protein